MEFYRTIKMNYYYIQNMDISQQKDWAKEIWYKKNHIWYDSVYTNFKNRQNNSMVLKSELVITFMEEQVGNDCWKRGCWVLTKFFIQNWILISWLFFCVLFYISVTLSKFFLFFLIKTMQCFIKSRCLSFIIIPNNFAGEKSELIF